MTDLKKRRVLFIDRDGTLLAEYPPSYKIDEFSKLQFYPYVFKYMTKIAEELDYDLVLASNQNGLGTLQFPDEKFWPIHNLVMSSFANEGIIFKEELIDGSVPEQHLPTRKPGIGMFTNYLNNPEYDLQNSYVIGDRITDVQLAKNLGCKALWLKNNGNLGLKEITNTVEELQKSVALETKHWKDIYEFLKRLG